MGSFELSQKADADLEVIYEYSIQNFGIEVARKYVLSLESAFETLINNPHIGHDLSSVKKDYRRYVYGRHAIYYKVLEKKILIIRILGPGQDPIFNL